MQTKKDHFSVDDDLKINPENNRVNSRECEHREFKLIFENKDIPRYAKTMAAFANRDGGIIFFGIKDRPRTLIGESEKNIPDDVVLSNFLKEYFEPEISFKCDTLKKNGKTLFFVQVFPSEKKPIICRKEKILKNNLGKTDKIILREGAIYYRYSSSSEEIKYPELRNILDNQVTAVFKSLIENVTLVHKVGYDRAAVVDARELSGDDKIASVFITKETAKNLNWIDSGSFTEEPDDGKNAYYVVKKVEVKQGIEVPKPTDYNKTHPITKSELMLMVKVNSSEINPVLKAFGIMNDPKYHICTKHGKNKNHKFTPAAKDLILSKLPLEMDAKQRKDDLKKLRNTSTLKAS